MESKTNWAIALLITSLFCLSMISNTQNNIVNLGGRHSIALHTHDNIDHMKSVSPNYAAADSSQVQAYVPITLTNSQSEATPSPFQEIITFDPSTYSSYESSDLGNIRFCADPSCNTELYAWLESCSPTCGPSATSATIWVQLSSSISGSGNTLTIYMIFYSTSTEFDGNYWGEAPQLSSSYAQYDNGANVFGFYDNFKGTSLDTSLWNNPVVGTIDNSYIDCPLGTGSITIDNGLTEQATSAPGCATAIHLYSKGTFSPSVLETFVTSTNAITSGPDDVGWNIAYDVDAPSTNYPIVEGYTNAYYFGGQGEILASNPFPSQITLVLNGGGVGYLLSSSSPVTTGIMSLAWPTVGNQKAFADYTEILSATDTSLSHANSFVDLVFNTAAAAQYFATYQWVRTRAYPPNGVMPTTTFGSVVSSTTPSFSISPMIGQSETTITASGSGFTANAEYTICFSTVDTSCSGSTQTFITDSQGNIPAGTTLSPPNNNPGTYYVDILSNGVVIVYATFTIPNISTTAIGSPFSVAQGNSIDVPIQVSIQGAGDVDWSLSVAWIPTGSNQWFTTKFTPPDCQCNSFDSTLTVDASTSAPPEGFTAQILVASDEGVGSTIVSVSVVNAKAELTLIPPYSDSGFSTDSWYASSCSSPPCYPDETHADPFGNLQLNGDLWDISSNSVGDVTMSYDSSLATSVDFSQASYGQDGPQVIGYPSLSYGQAPFNAGTSQYVSSSLPLPEQVSDLPDLISVASYSVTETSRMPSTNVPYDFAYDIFLTQSKPTSTTMSPAVGDLELMVWTGDQNGIAPHCTFYNLGCTATNVGDVSLPTLVNGVNEQLDWSEWINNGEKSTSNTGPGHWTTVYIILDSPISSGTIGVDLYQMISQMFGALLTNYPSDWTISSLQNYWLDEISLGSEFKPSTENNAIYSWGISDYCYFINYSPLDEGGSNYPCASTSSTSTTSVSTSLYSASLTFNLANAGVDGNSPTVYTFFSQSELSVSSSGEVSGVFSGLFQIATTPNPSIGPTGASEACTSYGSLEQAVTATGTVDSSGAASIRLDFPGGGFTFYSPTCGTSNPSTLSQLDGYPALRGTLSPGDTIGYSFSTTGLTYDLAINVGAPLTSMATSGTLNGGSVIAPTGSFSDPPNEELSFPDGSNIQLLSGSSLDWISEGNFALPQGEAFLNIGPSNYGTAIISGEVDTSAVSGAEFTVQLNPDGSTTVMDLQGSVLVVDLISSANVILSTNQQVTFTPSIRDSTNMLQGDVSTFTATSVSQWWMTATTTSGTATVGVGVPQFSFSTLAPLLLIVCLLPVVLIARTRFQGSPK